MPRLLEPLTITMGLRLSVEDRDKLHRLCRATERPVGEMIRTLIRLAQPTDVPAVRFGQPEVEIHE